jgi:hypothetical protein
MMNPVSSRAADLYARASAPPPAAAPARLAEAQAPKQAATPARTTTPADGLSAEEQRMIEAAFPPRPALVLKLYGPGRQQHAVSPDALGSRLDLRG